MTNDIVINLPSQESLFDGTETINRAAIFRYYMELVRNESRIYSTLYSAREQTWSLVERSKLVGELHKTWHGRTSCPWCPARTAYPMWQRLGSANYFDAFGYLSCLTIIHRFSIQHGSWTSSHHDMQQNKVRDGRHLNSRLCDTGAICFAAARQPIQLLNSVDFSNWRK